MRTTSGRLGVLSILWTLAAACSGSTETTPPEPSDASQDVTAVDSGDTGVGDTSAVDSSVADTGVVDTGVADTGVADTGSDTSPVDTGVDTSPEDTGADTTIDDTGADTAVPDTGVADTGVADTGVADTGPADTCECAPSAVESEACGAGTRYRTCSSACTWGSFGTCFVTTKIVAGGEYGCAIVAGALKCWGDNRSGQLGLGSVSAYQTSATAVPLAGTVVAVAASTSMHEATRGPHTCAITAGGALHCWGRNTYGALGIGTEVDATSPTAVPALASGVVQVAAGAGHTCAVTVSGALSCWGANLRGQLGLGDTDDRTTPQAITSLGEVVDVSAGVAFTCAVKKDGTLWCWGSNYVGQLGTGDTTDASTPKQVTAIGADAVRVVAGASHTCVLKKDGSVWCWGANFAGQLGYTPSGGLGYAKGPQKAVSLPAGEVIDLVAGLDHTCLRQKSVGEVRCWGANGRNQSNGETDPTLNPWPTSVIEAFVEVAPGGKHTCARAASGATWCWGDDTRGQLGRGTTSSTAQVPTKITL